MRADDDVAVPGGSCSLLHDGGGSRPVPLPKRKKTKRYSVSIKQGFQREYPSPPPQKTDIQKPAFFSLSQQLISSPALILNSPYT